MFLLYTCQNRDMMLGVEGDNIPHSMVVTFFSETRPNCSTLLLHDGSLICNGFGSAHIADELLDWELSVRVPH